MMDKHYPHLETERQGDVLIVRLANEAGRNALTREMRFSLRDVTRDIEDDRSIRAVYLTGKRIGLTGDQTVAIFGQGAVGLSCTLIAKAFGARVIALDVSDARLQMAKSLGADHLLNPRTIDPVAEIRALTHDGEGADAAIECSANRDARRQSIESVKRWGTACLVGAFGSMEFDVQNVVQLQKTLLGAVTFSKAMLNDAAQFVAERGIDLDQLFTHEFHIDEAEQAYASFDRGEITKGVFVFA